MIALASSARIEAPAARLPLGEAAVSALLGELATFPKPGLVSFVDNGSHSDMSARHFLRSAMALRPYYDAIAEAGAQPVGFEELRRLAVAAEAAMLRATAGVNTHRGAIFSVGLLAAAAGGAVPVQGPNARTASLGDLVRRRWGTDILAHRRDSASHGSSVTREHAAGGAQAEAAAGFPSVYEVALPAYRGVRGAGLSANAAAVQSFFALLAQVDDTNLLHRGGMAGLRFARHAARDFLDEGGVYGPWATRRALAAHRALVERKLSPGGCADLLAACLFVAALEP